MDYNDLSREELIEEIKRMKGEEEAHEEDSIEDAPVGDEDSDIMSAESMQEFMQGVLKFGGLDLSNLRDQFLVSMLNNMPNPAYFTDKEGAFIGYNQSFMELGPWKEEDLDGKKSFEIFPGRFKEIEEKSNEELIADGGILTYEIALSFNEKDLNYFSVSKSLFNEFDGSAAGIICVLNDITAKRAAEEALKKSEKKLRLANASKDKFFSVISHDLKNPVTAIRGYAEILHNDYDDFDESERKKFISEIKSASDLTFELLEQLLNWARSQTGNLEINKKDIDLHSVLSKILELIDYSAKQKKITIENLIHEGTFVKGDENIISTILRNLVSNAVKFTPEDGKVTIYNKQYDDFMLLTVEDTGIGISEEDMKKLFRIDINAGTIGAGKEKGTGLGLILCKEFIEKHGGRIGAESAPGKGSKFYFCV